MAFDSNLLKVSLVGIIFLSILAYLNYQAYRHPSHSTIIHQTITTCSSCELRLTDLQRSYNKKIEGLKSQIIAKEVEIKRLAGQRIHGGCPDVKELTEENGRLIVKIEELEVERKNFKKAEDELALCRKAYSELKEHVDAILR